MLRIKVSTGDSGAAGGHAVEQQVEPRDILSRTINAVRRAELAMRLTSNLSSQGRSGPSGTDDAFAFIPEHIPPEVDLISNIEEARRMSVLEFYDAVKNRGRWDYKQIDPVLYQEFGNFNYGVVAKAFGWPEWVALRAAGIAQIIAGTSSYEWASGYDLNRLLFVAPFGDDPGDQAWIIKGFRTYDALTGESYDGVPRLDTPRVDSGAGWLDLPGHDPCKPVV